MSDVYFRSLKEQTCTYSINYNSLQDKKCCFVYIDAVSSHVDLMLLAEIGIGEDFLNS